MDQDSFRRLLQTPRPGASSTPGSSTSRGSLLTSGAKARKAADTPQPAFKPRKVKKSSDTRYRDRAAERRVGEGNDYAQVEAVLEDFEKRIADSEDKDAVEEQRRYLGGDGDHSILVKGLDVALLEQNKARAALSTEDDDSLEQAFLEASVDASVPRKRTREDLIRELKLKRAQAEGGGEVVLTKIAEEEALLLEEAKKKGKFKPIGFTPIAETKGKRKKVKGDGKDGEKKKKRKVGAGKGTNTETTKEKGRMLPPPVPVDTTPKPSSSTSPPFEAEVEPPANDLDIFADAGEYQGLNLSDDEGEEEALQENKASDFEAEPLANLPRRWISTDEPGQLPEEVGSLAQGSGLRSPAPEPIQEDGEDEVEQPTRLVPLASSALPSIKDFLAMDQAAGAAGKRRKRKEKKGNKDDDGDSKKLTAEVRAERDYKRLKTYTDKKAGVSK